VPPVKIASIESLKDFIGRELATSDWLVITQERISAFAAATGDRQWIHLDRERAEKESPYGTTIAHGNLTLSLIDGLRKGLTEWSGFKLGVNYGWNKVRFPAPVRAGARVRLRVVLIGVEPRDAGQLVIKMRNTVEIEGSDKPALVAETLALLVPGKSAGSGEA